jgi:two-component system LytT family response regulator
VRTLIVDDERPARSRLQALLQHRSEIDLVGVGTDGREAVRLIRDLAPQLLFLDIEMPHLDGFAVLREVPRDRLPATVFVTAYDRFAVAAFEAQAVDYLLKPFSDERFEAALARALVSIRDTSPRDRSLEIESVLEERQATDIRSGLLERVVIRASGRVLLIALRDIDWIAAAGVYVEVYVGGTAHLYRSSLNALLQRLPPRSFIRVHRSVAVNTDRIVELRPKGHGDYVVVLKNGRELPLSRAFRADLEGWLGQTL